MNLSGLHHRVRRATTDLHHSPVTRPGRPSAVTAPRPTRHRLAWLWPALRVAARSMADGRWPRVVSLVMFMLLVVAGCTMSTVGSPQPISATSSARPTVSRPAGEPDVATNLAVINPCALLTQAQIDQFGLRKTDDGDLAGARQCSWTHPSDKHARGGYAVGPAIWDHQGLKDINANGYMVTDRPIGRHEGRQARQIDGDGCFISIGVANSARVDVVVVGEPGTACRVANEFATLMEPLLPGGSS